MQDINPPPRHTTPGWHRFLRSVARLLIVPIERVDLQGLENIPAQGAFVGVMNHLSSFDTLTMLAVAPVLRASVFAAIEHRSDFIAGWALDKLRVIWVRRGEADREAIRIALDELKSGSVLGVAIEGTRSRTGALQEGKTGAVYLATRANAPILPVTIWGTEKVKHNLRRFKRSTVHIRIGTLIHLPEGRAGAAQLQAYTEEVMLKLAAMLPPEYHGVYRGQTMINDELAN